MKRFAVFIIVLVLVTGCEPDKSQAQGGFLTDRLIIQSQDGTKHKFNIELAISQEQQQQGLMNRTEMGENEGMLFWFGGKEEQRSFWMRNTLIPLDMLFIKANGTIHHIHSNARPLDLTGVPSNGKVAAVLELNGGTAEKLGIKPGDTVKQRFFKE